MSTATVPSQAKRQTTVPHKEPITIDFFLERAAKVVLNPKLLALLPLLTYFYDRNRVSASRFDYPGPAPSTLFGLLFGQDAPYRKIGAFWALIALRTAHQFLVRYIRNHGEWKADKPDYARDVFLVTGGSAGMGKGVVEILSHVKKAKIAVLDFAEPTYAPAPPNAPEILFIKTDVSDPESIANAAAKIKEHFGTDPSFVLNSAGIASGQTLLDTPKDFMAKVWRVNSYSHFLMAQQFLPPMIKRGHGHFATIASGASFAALPQMGPYACSKAYALAFHEVLSGELRTRYGPKGRKVRNSLFCPTKVATGLGDTMSLHPSFPFSMRILAFAVPVVPLDASFGAQQEDHPNQFLTPVLTSEQCSQWLVDVFDSGLSQFLIAPQHARLLPLWRVIPDYGRRAFELIAHTDASMTEKSWNRAVGHGYTKNWDK
ncbi:hypothetical protein OC842_001216 [Tilletia horrida]|uniref:NAD(P)-binding protein n=1 Tax=Tilletia horrida TaxID=155126 RepID=A0AAN6GFH3_9BASI|nr:hypothetical protein OC842_001216 [Tilletia horrida]KAK0564627.1 hypothetical protein OC844_001618 [Tilletia horrida]